MRVLMLSKACIVGQYQTKLEALARKPDIELTVLVPPFWQDERGVIPLERSHLEGYKLTVTSLAFNGHYHLHFYPRLREIVARVQPDILHIDEEPYNFATFHALLNLRRSRRRARVLFFTWQNLLRKYPPPFSWLEQYVYTHSQYALAGSDEAGAVLRDKGFVHPIRIIPQFGVDPNIFNPIPRTDLNRGRAIIGFAGRLVEEKGTGLLLRALARIDSDWELRVLGSGPLKQPLAELARSLQIAGRVHFQSPIPSTEMPRYFNALDLLVVPSLSRPNWKEQFGRVIMEAMACGVPVIGSDSGEIPNVIGDAGLIFREGNVDALIQAVLALIHDPTRRAELGARGRARVLEKFTQARVVDETYTVYQELTR